MSKNKPGYNPSDAEKRDLIALIQGHQGQVSAAEIATDGNAGVRWQHQGRDLEAGKTMTRDWMRLDDPGSDWMPLIQSFAVDSMKINKIDWLKPVA